MAENGRSALIPPAIPRTIHQIWLQGEKAMPGRYRILRRSWLIHHPAWEHRLWDDAAIRALLAERHPWFLETYEAYPHLHQRVDAGRYFILYEHGGVYADLDTECLRPLDGLLLEHPGAGLVVSVQPFGALEARFIRLFVGTRHILTNAVMASAVRAPALGVAVRRLPRSARRFALLKEMNITYSTGPAFLSMVLAPAIRADPCVVVLPAACFEPHFGFDPAAARETAPAPDRYVAHSQDATWHAPALKALFRSYFRVKQLFGIGEHG